MSQRQGTKRSVIVIACAMSGWAFLAPFANAAPGGRQAVLPTSFIGEAATLALAFAAPALCAGIYLLFKRLAKRTGTPIAIGLSVATVTGGLALAIGGRFDLLTSFGGS
jgi:hypothetical protein